MDGTDGWTPNNSLEIFHITNVPSARDGSVIVVNTNNDSQIGGCLVNDVYAGGFTLRCHPARDGSFLDYVVINRP